MRIYLACNGIELSVLTVHKYMNTELGLRSIVRWKAPRYHGGTQHKKFENLLKQDFTTPQINQKWATDFTYLFLHGGDVRYHCTIIDLHDRSVVASLMDRRMTSDLAIRTLGKALSSQRKRIKGLLLHSDQGSPYTSKALTDFCEQHGLRKAWARLDARMIMPLWSAISIRWRTKKFIFMSIEMRNLSIAQWNILLIPHTTMYDHILITAIVRYSKRGIRHKFIGHSCYKNAWPQQ